MAFYAEPAAASEVPGDISTQLGIIVSKLQLVSNNTPSSVGGGGTRQTRLAPPLP